MRKIPTFVAASVLALAFGSVVAGQAVAQSMAISSIVTMDHTMRSSKLIGMDVFNAKGTKIGKIEDILIKGSASEPVAVLSVGGFVGKGDKMVGVPVSHIHLKNDVASMQATQAQLAAMPNWHFQGLNGGGG